MEGAQLYTTGIKWLIGLPTILFYASLTLHCCLHPLESSASSNIFAWLIHTYPLIFSLQMGTKTLFGMMELFYIWIVLMITLTLNLLKITELYT